MSTSAATRWKRNKPRLRRQPAARSRFCFSATNADANNNKRTKMSWPCSNPKNTGKNANQINVHAGAEMAFRLDMCGRSTHIVAIRMRTLMQSQTRNAAGEESQVKGTKSSASKGG